MPFRPCSFTQLWILQRRLLYILHIIANLAHSNNNFYVCFYILVNNKYASKKNANIYIRWRLKPRKTQLFNHGEKHIYWLQNRGGTNSLIIFLLFLRFWMLSPLQRLGEFLQKPSKTNERLWWGYDVAPSGGRHLKKKNKFSSSKKAIKQSDKEFLRQVLEIESD